MTTIEQPTAQHDTPHPEGPFQYFDREAEIQKAGYDGPFSSAMTSVPETDHDTLASEAAFERENQGLASDRQLPAADRVLDASNGNVSIHGAQVASELVEDKRAENEQLSEIASAGADRVADRKQLGDENIHLFLSMVKRLFNS